MRTTEPAGQTGASASTSSQITASTAPLMSPSWSLRNGSPFRRWRRVWARTTNTSFTSWPSARSRTKQRVVGVSVVCSIGTATVRLSPDGLRGQRLRRAERLDARQERLRLELLRGRSCLLEQRRGLGSPALVDQPPGEVGLRPGEVERIGELDEDRHRGAQVSLDEIVVAASRVEKGVGASKLGAEHRRHLTLWPVVEQADQL